MKEKISILLNASLLTNFFEMGNIDRTGIFFTVYNVLKEFERLPNFNITLLINNNRYKFVQKMKNDLFFSKFSYFKFYDEQLIFYRINLIKTYKNFIKTNTNIFINTLYILKIIKHYIYVLYYCLMKYIHNIKKICKKIDIFLSLDSIIHNEIIKCTHIKNFVFLHDTMPLIFPEYYPSFFSTKNHIIEYAYIRNLNKEYYYFCNSECTKRDHLKYYKNQLDEKKIIVTYISSSQNFYPDYDKKKLAAVFNKYKVEHRNNDEYIFSLCTLEPRKNLVFTVKCFINFIKKHNIKNLYFYLGGAQWDKFIHLLEEQIDSLKEYQKKIIRFGYIDDNDVNILYSNSLFFTYISQYEGFGMPPLEAMQAGTPVITSNNSSLPEVVGDAAIMIDYDSEEQCIKAFENLYFSEDLRKHYIKKGLERAKLFSWKKTVKKMSDVILKTVL